MNNYGLTKRVFVATINPFCLSDTGRALPRKHGFSKSWPFLILIVVLTVWSTDVDGQDLSLSELHLRGLDAFKAGKYEEAAAVFRLAVERAESEKAPDSTRVMLLSNLAEQLRLTGQYDESAKIFDSALRILR